MFTSSPGLISTAAIRTTAPPTEQRTVFGQQEWFNKAAVGLTAIPTKNKCWWGCDFDGQTCESARRLVKYALVILQTKIMGATTTSMNFVCQFFYYDGLWHFFWWINWQCCFSIPVRNVSRQMSKSLQVGQCGGQAFVLMVVLVNGDHLDFNLPSLEESTMTRNHLGHLRTGKGDVLCVRPVPSCDITWCVLLCRRPLVCLMSRLR